MSLPTHNGLQPPWDQRGGSASGITTPDADYYGLHTGRLASAYALVLLYLLSLPTLKVSIGFDIRAGQLLLIAGFGILVLRDLQLRAVRWRILFFFLGAGLFLSGVSVIETYAKIKQITFIIKYLFIFPAAFYTGIRLPLLLSWRQLIPVMEITLVLACLVSILVNVHPIPLLVHARPLYLSYGLRGTFWEQGDLAFFIGLFTVAALALRIRHAHWPASRIRLLPVYALALGSAVATHNKTVWLAMLAAIFVTVIIYRDPVTKDTSGTGISIGGNVMRRWIWRLVFVAILLAIALVIYNANLAPGDKIWSASMLQNKWQNERGAAFRIALTLIPQRPLFGHGFGFVEAYFTTHPTDIIGLGTGVADIFNSYLDLWITSGFIGFAFALTVVGMSFRRRSLVSIMLVTYLFVAANFNPVAQSEYYYLFMGMAYAFGHEPPFVSIRNEPSWM